MEYLWDDESEPPLEQYVLMVKIKNIYIEGMLLEKLNFFFIYTKRRENQTNECKK